MAFFQVDRAAIACTVINSIAALSPITPSEPLPPLPVIPRGSLVIVEGRAPIWRYGMALHLLHGSPAAAIAFYDPQLGAVVVASHSSLPRSGGGCHADHDERCEKRSKGGG